MFTNRLLIPSLVLLAAALPAAAQDMVTLKDGKTESGRVKSADYDGLVVESKGSAKTLEWGTIASIEYKDRPEEYDGGKESYAAGKWDEALAAFDKLKSDAKLRAPIRQEAFYLAARCQLGKANWDAAITALDATRKEFPKSRYLMEIGEGYVMAFTAKKDFVGAQKALDTMSNDAVAAGVPGGFSATISMLSGRLLEDQGKIPEAAAKYGVAEKASGVSLVVQQEARLGQARCLSKQNKHTEAEAMFRKLTGEDASNAVLAGAWNGIGDLWRGDAKASGKSEAEQAEKLLDAAFAYMRGVVQYGPGPGESMREYRRSLEGAMVCYQNLQQIEKNAEKKQAYLRRYQERKAALDQEFPAGR